MSFNKVILVGNLTRDPEIKEGIGVCEFGMAMNRQYVDRDGQKKDEPCFVDVSMWGKRGEVIARFFRKGDGILIEGRLHWREWTDKDSGQKRNKLSVVAENFEFLPRRGASGGDGEGRGEPRAESDHFADQRGGYDRGGPDRGAQDRGGQDRGGDRRPAPRRSYGPPGGGEGGPPNDQYQPDDSDVPF